MEYDAHHSTRWCTKSFLMNSISFMMSTASLTRSILRGFVHHSGSSMYEPP